MSFDWETYLKLSDILENLQDGTDLKEASLRSAISRYYYGVFILARDWLKQITGLNIPKGRTHSFVIGKYKAGTSTARAIGANLSRLKREREKADYMSGANITKAVVQRAKGLSYATLNNLNSIKSTGKL
jgi:uncharacterized protein (UPF0332 family)